MDINRSNYEIYAIDFIEGKLAPADAAEFLAFLGANPDLSNEIELLRENTLELSHVPVSSDFSGLKKDINRQQITEDNFDEFCIAFHEGDLNDQAKSKLLKYVNKKASLKFRFETYGKLRVVPDLALISPRKKDLRQYKLSVFSKKEIAWYTAIAAAAVSVFFIVSVLFRQPENEIGPIATTNEEVISIPERLVDIEPVEAVNKEVESNVKKAVKAEFIVEREELVLAENAIAPEEEFNSVNRIELREIKNQVKKETIVQRDFALTQKNTNERQSQVISEIRSRGNRLFANASRLTVTDIIQSGIKGINSLTETDLKYETITDENGKVKEYALSSESFNIKRKTRRN